MLPAGAATPAGRRNCGLAEEIARVERAALDWGLHADALEGRFVQALLKAIEETGRTNLATLGDLEALLEKVRREGDADRIRVERLVEAASNALAMAHRASEDAGVASAHAQQMVDQSVAGIQARMSKAVVEGCPQWLIFEQKARHRLYAWRLAAWVAAGAVAVFIAGVATTQWWNAKESAARQAMLEALDRCWVQPVIVRTAEGKTVEMCRLADLTTDRPN
ncbi:MAG TPA: hypothetical protein VGG79_04350 [Roseiarcus sp.]|jgi:hypothetical protein